jgi:hypothetical protein
MMSYPPDKALAVQGEVFDSLPSKFKTKVIFIFIFKDQIFYLPTIITVKMKSGFVLRGLLNRFC